MMVGAGSGQRAAHPHIPPSVYPGPCTPEATASAGQLRWGLGETHEDRLDAAEREVAEAQLVAVVR